MLEQAAESLGAATKNKLSQQRLRLYRSGELLAQYYKTVGLMADMGRKAVYEPKDFLQDTKGIQFM